MLLPRVLGELPRRVSNDPYVDEQLAGVRVHSHYLGPAELEVLVGIGRLDAVAAGSIAEHAIARHLNVDGMRLAVAERVRENPLHTLVPARQSLERLPVVGPDQALVVRIPVQLEQILVTEFRRHREDDLEPVR